MYAGPAAKKRILILKPRKMKFETLQIHAGRKSDPTTGAVATPIYQTNAFEFRNIEHGRQLFSLEEAGNIYTRLSNPTTAVLEERIAALEGGTAAVAVASGMSAQFMAIQNICDAGDNIISSFSLYGGTYNQFKISLPRLGIEVKFNKLIEEEEIEKLIDCKTKAIYVETIANSDFSIPNFELLSKIAKKHQILLIVDNTLGCGGYVCQPAQFGANIIVHSATKAIGGHGNSIGGIIIDCGNFNWDNPKFPHFTTPSASYKGLSFAQYFPTMAFAARLRLEGLRDYGCCISPFNSFLLLAGVETLSLRSQRVCSNALELAKWLEKHPKVESVNYPGLENHPSHLNGLKYLTNGFGGVMTVDIKASRENSAKVVDKLEIFSLMANLGDNKSIVAHPATTTHGQLQDQELLNIGIKPGTLRLSIGIEHISDILADFEQALAIL